jgi:replicative DNA helicase
LRGRAWGIPRALPFLLARFFLKIMNSSNRPTDPQLDALRVPPHSIEAEQSVLGSLLLDNAAWDHVSNLVLESDFYRYDHRLIFKHIVKNIELGRPADVLTVFESLKIAGQAEQVGSMEYLNSLARNTPSAANVQRYAEIVRDRSILRRLVSVADDIATTAMSPEGRDVKQILDEAESKILGVAEKGVRGQQGFINTKDVMKHIVDRIVELAENPSELTGVKTGFIDLDRMTSGLQGGDLIIVAGRPSMGKAQPLDAQVLTFSRGWTTIGDLCVGDVLAAVDAEPSVVTGLYPQGEKQVYGVRFSDGRAAECCEEHLWQVSHSTWPLPRVLSTKDLIDLLQYKCYQKQLCVESITGVFGHHEPLPIDPWLLGVWLVCGDSIYPAILEKAVNTLGGTVIYDAQTLFEALKKLSLLGCKSDQRFIPQAYLEANRTTRLSLAQGLLDAKGEVRKSGQVFFSTANQVLANHVADLFRSLGAWCEICVKSAINQKEIMYQCRISYQNPRTLFRLSSKKERLSEHIYRQKPLAIESILPTRKTACMCISVSHQKHLYITNQYIVTHNTAFSVNIGEYIALDTGGPVVIFSMEMSAAQLLTRMVGSIGRIEQQRLRTGSLHHDEWDRFSHAVNRISDAPILIDETPALTPFELRARARRVSRQYGGKIGVIIVDYLQLMTGSNAGKNGENRATEISEISRSLKALAKELHCPVIALSQLNRSLEQRPNKRPQMSDLRESGAIEQDADVILFIYRDEVYNPDSAEKGVAEIIIGKQRNGPIGTVRLTFEGRFTKFENFAGSRGHYDTE